MIVTARRTETWLPGAVALSMCLGVILMGQLQFSLVQGAVLADLVIGVVIVWWVWASADDLGRMLGRKLALPAVVTMAGSLIAFAPSGLAEWGARDLILDVGAILTFLAVYAAGVRANNRQWRLILGALALSLLVVTLQLLGSRGDELRAVGSFPNPNLAGHFAVTVTATLLMVAKTRTQFWAIAVLGTIAWAVSGSFGALLQALVMIAYVSWRSPQRARALAVFAAVVGLAGAAWLVLPATPTSGTVSVAGVSTDRLDRSGEGRLEKWIDGIDALGERPWGVGPGAVEALGYTDGELHNEVLAYLVERGPLGLLGLLLVAATLWRHGSASGRARTLLIGFAAASVFRETSHYRHLWVCLALALALEARNGRAEART